MTKKVRIENADTAKYQVQVEVWAKGQDGTEDIREQVVTLLNPTDLQDFTLWQGRYLIVREAE